MSLSGLCCLGTPYTGLLLNTQKRTSHYYLMDKGWGKSPREHWKLELGMSEIQEMNILRVNIFEISEARSPDDDKYVTEGEILYYFGSEDR